MNHSQTLVKKKKRRNAVFQERGKERARGGGGKNEQGEFRVSNWLDDNLSPFTGLLNVAHQSGDDDSRIYFWTFLEFCTM